VSLRALLFVYDLHGIPHIISLLCNDMCIKYIMRIDVNFVCICVILAALWYIVMMIQVTSNSLLSNESKRQLCSFSSQIYLIFFCYLINRLCANFQTLNSSYFIFRAVFKSVRGRRGCEYLFSKLFLTLRKKFNYVRFKLYFVIQYRNC